MAARGHGIGTMVPDIAARLREDGATEVTEAETAAATVVATEAIAAAMAASKRVEAARSKAAAVVRHRLAGQERNRNRSNSRRARLTSAARTGISHRRFKGHRAPKGTTDPRRFLRTRPSLINRSGTAFYCA